MVAYLTRPMTSPVRAIARSGFSPVAWGLAALAALTLVLAVDDIRMHRMRPYESREAHRYMDAVVHLDPAAMWDAYSPQARAARGGDRAAFIAYMLLGTHPPAGKANAYRLVARVPLDSGRALLYYQVDVATASGPQHFLFPVVIGAQGAVDDAAGDGVSFVPPTAPGP